MRKILFLTIFLVVAFFLSDGYALTPEQVIELKRAGVSEKTIQLMLKQEADQRVDDAYNKIGAREVTDSQGNTTVIYSTGGATVDREEQQKVDNAWKMLKNIKIEQKH